MSVPLVWTTLAWSMAPTDNFACIPDQHIVTAKKLEATQAFQDRDYIKAGAKMGEVADMYAGCVGITKSRAEYLNAALTAFRKAKRPGPACQDPDLLAARLLRRTEREPALGKFEKAWSQLPEIARNSAGFLEGVPGSAPLDATIADYRAVTAKFGECPDHRAALLRAVLAHIPEKLPSPPSCDPATESARDAIRRGLQALEQDASGRDSPEYRVLTDALARLNDEGNVVRIARAAAVATRDPDSASDAWAAAARGLPGCATYLKSLHEATTHGVDGWSRGDAHQRAARERDSASIALLDEVIEKLGDAVPRLDEHELYTALVKLRADQPPLSATTAAEKGPYSDKKEPPDDTSQRAAHRRRVGLGLSGALAGAALGAAIGLTVVDRRHGIMYDRIVDAWWTAGLNPYTSSDLCGASATRAATPIASACDQHRDIRHAAVGMWIVGSMATVSTIALGIVHAKHTRHNARVVVTPGFMASTTTWILRGTLRF